ncbi:MAG: twin-arginine translocation signal domain-containing protein, partial [Planctomycetaceae bacterium]
MSAPLDRRNFLGQATAAIATAAAAAPLVLSAPAPASAAPDKPRKIRKAVKYSMVGGDAPLVEKFKMLKEVGFEGIDMDKPA